MIGDRQDARLERQAQPGSPGDPDAANREPGSSIAIGERGSGPAMGWSMSARSATERHHSRVAPTIGLKVCDPAPWSRSTRSELTGGT